MQTDSNQILETAQSDFTIERAKAKPEQTPEVDLCFMLDCTGSMSGYIGMACNKIKDIIVEVQQTYPQSGIRIGIVGYRDINDNPGLQMFSFKNSSEEAKSFLGTLSASGGGDTPEDINGAFQKVLFEMSWESPVRILVHIADAPCHGKEFHSCDDSYPKGYKGDMNWDRIFKQLVELHLDYLFLKIHNTTDQMFTMFKAMAEKHGAIEMEISFKQELANQSSALQAQAEAVGVKASAKPEDHFAATIADTVKAGVHKEMKKGLANKLNKRIEENAELVNNIKKSVAETVSKLNIEELRTKYSGLAAKVGDCILSSNNFIDAIADEDCLCLTFDIGRSQAAIADPTQIIIKNVYPSFLTAGSFFYSSEYALKKDKLAHGGFEKHAEGLILKGAASENITGVMPLYFCEENWKVAKQLMKMTIGWDVTLDALGYTYSQMKTVPFLILAKLAEMVHEKPSAEFLKFQFELVKRTCMKIMEDGSKEHFETKFNKEVMDLYNKYVEDASIRTIDSIPNNSIFLAQLYIAMENDGVSRKCEEYFDKLFKGMLEEELRRKQKNLPDDLDTTEWLFKMLNVDVENYITRPVQAYIDSQLNSGDKPEMSKFEQNFLKISSVLRPSNREFATDPTGEKKKEETKTEDMKATKGDPRSTELMTYKQSFTNTEGVYSDAHKKAREEYASTLRLVMKYLYPLRSLFAVKPAENPTSFLEWDIKTDNQFFTLYIQNKLHFRNAARREAISAGTYKNPWTQPEEFIQTWYNKLIENEKANRVTKFVTSIKDAKSARQATVFASTSNLNEAAGALLGTCIGGNVMDFWNKLCEGGYPKSAEKIKMMLTGHYKGVKLYKDDESWAPGRRNGNLIFRGNKRLFTSEEWVEMIPALSARYVNWVYDR